MLRPSLPFASLLALAAAAAVTAQGGAPTFVPNPHMVRARAEDVPKLLAQLPQSAIGKLLAEPEVAAAWAAGLRRYRERADRHAALVTAVYVRDVQVEPWLVAQLPLLDGFAAVRAIDLADLQRFELTAVRNEDHARDAHSAVILQCSPRAEGRWSGAFEKRAQALQQSKAWQVVPDAKFGGFPAYVFEVQGRTETSDPDLFDSRIWMLHLPGVFAFGGGTPEACGTLAAAPPKPEAQLLGELDLEAYVGMFGRFGGVPSEFTALGFADLKALRWRGRFQGALVLDEFEAELAGEPKGLIGALLAGKAPLPAQPLPDGALAQMRLGLDLQVLLSTLRELSGGDAMSEPIEKLVARSFTGGVALGATAPAAGGLIPRIFLSFGIADDKALDELLANLFPGNQPAAAPAHGDHEPRGTVASKKVAYEGVECTVLTVPGLPSAMQPTFCCLDHVLHVAESGLSMRAFLKARAKGGDAMDVGDAPLPQGTGDVLPTFDVRCDEQALYRTFHKVWLPLFKLIPDGGELQPLLTEQEMPSPDAVLPLLGRSRGVLRKDGATFRLQQLGALGGVELAALAMTWGPFVSGIFHRDYAAEQLERDIAKAQLEACWPVFEAFQKKNLRWPNDLGELFADKQLPADALVLPGDTGAEAVKLPAGDDRVILSSFRYFAKPVAVDDGQGGDTKALLIAIRPQRYYRPMLTDQGVVPQIWSEDSRKPIDQFGK